MAAARAAVMVYVLARKHAYIDFSMARSLDPKRFQLRKETITTEPADK